MAGPNNFEQRTFVKTVATAGSHEALFGSEKKVKSFVVIALAGNTGDGSVRHTKDEVADAFPMAPNAAYGASDPDPAKAVDFFDLNEYRVDVATNGDGFQIIYQALGED